MKDLRLVRADSNNFGIVDWNNGEPKSQGYWYGTLKYACRGLIKITKSKYNPDIVPDEYEGIKPNVNEELYSGLMGSKVDEVVKTIKSNTNGRVATKKSLEE